MLGLDTALVRFFFDTDKPNEQRRVIGTAFWTMSGWAVVLVALAFAAAPVIADYILGQRSYTPYLRLALLSLPFTVIHVAQLLILRVRFAFVRYNMLALGNLVLGAGMGVLLSAGFGYGLRGIFVGILIGYSITEHDWMVDQSRSDRSLESPTAVDHGGDEFAIATGESKLLGHELCRSLVPDAGDYSDGIGSVRGRLSDDLCNGADYNDVSVCLGAVFLLD